jgi:hypothetical protein
MATIGTYAFIFINDKNLACWLADAYLHANVHSTGEDVPNRESCNAVRRLETPNTDDLCLLTGALRQRQLKSK